MWVNHAACYMHFKPTLDRVKQTCARIRCFDTNLNKNKWNKAINLMILTGMFCQMLTINLINLNSPV